MKNYPPKKSTESFKKTQPISSGEPLVQKTHQDRHTQNPPQKSGDDYKKACRKNGGPLYS